MTFGLGFGLPRGGSPAGLPAFAANFIGGSLPTGSTFSRGTIGTLYNQSGLVAYAPSNLNLYSQDFTNAAWIKVAVTFGTSGTAPDGTATMALVNATNAVPSWIYQVVTVTASTTYTVSYYVKQGTSSAQLIRIFDGTLATLIAAAGVFWSSGVPTLGSITGYASTSIAPVGNGIYRFTGTFSSGAYTSIGALFHPDPNNTGLNTYVWGAQLEQGSNATTYTPTTSVAVYGPRFDFDPNNVLQQNQYLYSTIFNISPWNATFVTVGTNTNQAPDGTYTATNILNSVGIGSFFLYILVDTIGVTYTRSIYAKAGVGNGICYSEEGGGATSVAGYNLLTGTIISVSGTGSATITPVGNGWYFCTHTYTPAIAQSSHVYYVGAYGATSIQTSISFWGAQYNVGSVALPYLATNGLAKTVCAPKGLLIEEARTNLLTYSDQFDNAFYSKSNSTVTANSATSPDGTTNADSLIRGATNSGESMLRITTTQAISTAYTFSVYAKAVTAGAYFYLRNLAVDGGLPSGLVVFNLANGTIVSSGSSYPSPIITSVGNGWYRCVISGTTPASITNNLADIGVCNIANAVTGISGDTIYIYGAQLEAGAFATSYVPTTSATVTRNFDSLGITAISSWYNTAQGTVLAAFDTNYLTGAIRIIGTQTAATPLSINGGGAISIYDGANVTTSNLISTNTVAKAASTYVGSSFTICLNGATPTSGAGAGTYPFSGVTAIYFGCQAGNQNFLNGHIRSFSYYNYTLTNAQLQQVTT